MTEYLPDVHQQSERRFPTVKATFDSLGAAEHEAVPLAEKERRLVKFGVAVGVKSEGGVRSHVRNVLGIGTSQEEVWPAQTLIATYYTNVASGGSFVEKG